MISFLSTYVEHETKEGYVISESGRYVAWVDAKKIYSSECIYLEDLKTGITYEVKADENEYVLPVAFVGEDFVYGIAKKEDVKENLFAETVYPMSTLKILNTSEEKRDVIKSYVAENNKIGEVSVDSNNIYIELVKEVNGQLIAYGQDTIMNRETEPANAVKLRKSVTDKKQTQIAINMKEIKKNSFVKQIVPKSILLEEERIVRMDVKMDGYFYAYSRGKLVLATKDAGEAIRYANQNQGFVMDSNSKYIFKRARSTTQTALTNLVVNEADVRASSLIKAVSSILAREGVGISVSDLVAAGQSPIQIMQSTLKGSNVLEINDCTIDA